MQNALAYISRELKTQYPVEEIQSFSYLIFEHLMGYSRMQLHLNRDKKLPEAKVAELCQIVNRLKDHEPIQYILGQTEFYDLTFRVTPAVLIPRPETEELVDWIVHNHPNFAGKLLDIGTGSGCIPLSLKNNFNDAFAEGWDISEKALALARENASANQLEVHFSHHDILTEKNQTLDKKLDIIVSNPPYVKQLEKEHMEDNVLNYEPHLALFVENNDPLIFYRSIAEFALINLRPHGNLYFEINEAHGDEMCEMLQQMGFIDIELRKDLQGRDRMMHARLKE